MKNITAQYQSLLEGKMSKANFMVNVRREFPQWISPTNSFTDAVSILKSKRIITEIKDSKVEEMYDPEGYDEGPDAMFGVKKDLSSEKDAVGSLGILLTQGAELDWAIAKVKKDYPDVDIDALLDRYNKHKEAGSPIVKHDDDLPFFESLDRAVSILKSKKSLAEMDSLGKWTGNDYISPEELTAMDKVIASGNAEKDTKAVEFIKATIKNGASQEDAIKQASQKYGIQVDYLAKKYEAALDAEDTATINKYEKEKQGELDVADQYAIGEAGLTGRGHIGGEAARNNKKQETKLNEAVSKPEGKYKDVTGKALYSTFPELDRLNPYEFKKGMAIEMDMQYSPIPNFFTDKFNPEAVNKAAKKVIKNLQKDPTYYSNSISAVEEKKSGLLQHPKELKKGPDGMSKIKGFENAPANTQDTLNRKEKAKSKNAEGVKIMKESAVEKLKQSILKEFIEVGEVKKNFSKGEAVMTPHGAGTVEESTSDNTHTVKLDNGETRDYQGNVLKKHTPSTQPAGHGHQLGGGLEPHSKITGPGGGMGSVKKPDDRLKKLAGITNEIVNSLKKEAFKFKAGGETIFTNNQDAAAKEAELKRSGVKYVKSNA